MKTAPRFIRDVARELVVLAQTENAVPRIGRDLATIADVFAADPSVVKRLQEPSVPLEERRHAVVHALKDAVHPGALNATLLLLQERALPSFHAFANAYRSLARERAGHHDAVVTSVVPLTDAERERLKRALERRLRGSVELSERTDPGIGGGFVVQAGDWRFDASLRGYGQRLARTLSA